MIGQIGGENLREAFYFERDYEQEELQHYLTDGLVIRINTKLLHKAVPLSTRRYDLTFRSSTLNFCRKWKGKLRLG